MKNAQIANADYALVMHNGEWLKIYDAGTTKNAVLWSGPVVFSGYYSRFNNTGIQSSADSKIKLNRKFSDLNKGIMLNFYAYKHSDTVAAVYEQNSLSVNAHTLLPQSNVFISKQNLVSNTNLNYLLQGVVDNGKYTFQNIHAQSDGVDTIQILDDNHQPTSFIGNTGNGDLYLIFDEITAV